MHKILLVLAALNFLPSYSASAQEKPREFSPYSRFGIGDLSDPNFNVISQFGGAAAGYTDRNLLNPANPASLGALKNTAFEVGVSSKFTSLIKDEFKSRFFGGGLDYIGIGLPLYNAINEALDRKDRKWHIGTMFALKPYSQVGYDIEQLDSITGTGKYIRKYSGNGGTYEFKWSTGIEYKSLSAGFGFSYLFGKMSYNRAINLVEAALPYNTVFQNDISLSSLRWNYGFQYKINLKKLAEEQTESSNYLSIGLHGTPSQRFKTSSDELYKRELINGTTGVTDTVRNLTGLSGTGRLPGEVSIGAYYNSNYKFQASVQYSLVNWQDYINTAKNTTTPEVLKNTRNFSIGLAYTPNIQSFDNLLERVTYRLGFKVGNDPRFIGNEQLKNLTVTFGGSIPFVFQRKVSFVNFAVETGNVGIADKLKSRFVQMKLGFTLNDDEWFLKRKYN